jgi:hypothetical protein
MRAFLVALAGTLGLACSSVPAFEACVDNGTPNVPPFELRGVGLDLKISCTADTGEQNTLELSIKSSWLREAAAGFAAGLGAGMLAEKEPPPDPKPKPRPIPARIAVDPKYSAPLALACGSYTAPPPYCYP